MRPLLSALSLLTLTLAACGSQAPTAAHDDLVAVTLTGPQNLASQGLLGTLGLPTDPATGVSTLKTLQVTVTREGYGPVFFDSANRAVTSGGTSTVSFSTSSPSTTLYLPKGSYTFETRGLNATNDVRAYGRLTGQAVSGLTLKTPILLPLSTITDNGKTTFQNLLPWTSVYDGDLLDLGLNVRTADGDLVPTGDYSVQYSVVSGNGTVQSGSPLGTRIRVADSPSSALTVQAVVTFRADNDQPASITKTFTLPYGVTTTPISADTQAPNLTLDPLPAATVGQRITVQGSVSDSGSGLSAVRVYDGVTLVGSTDSSEFVRGGAAPVVVTGDRYRLVFISRNSVPRLTVVARDRAGNEQRVSNVLTLEHETVSAGYDFALGLRPDGTVIGWGNNAAGPTSVPAALSNVVAVSAGVHSLALKRDGTVVAWGNNGGGQLNLPAGLTDVVALSAGLYHSLALKRDGTVVAWGEASNGRTVVPTGLSDVVAVSAGYSHSLALKRGGTVVAWGYGALGQTTVPAGLSDVVAISAGGYHNLALKRDGTVVAWGQGDQGQTTVPAGLTDVVAVSAGGFHSLALKRDGTVVAWGDNSSGQTAVPAALTDVVAISGGNGYSLALRRDGTLVAWGQNSSGELNAPAGSYLVP